ncbi:hypothetical protein [Acetobacteroides hydrogenigenes]|uniref:Uncharacterized protein n=1 Tax=Acetobacteroides hydrogenigenes TaxID=979970 RepID=A0A4R2EM53_9BACT|nr:hypothetical protein [Acetobacteroides hydrogenigenes]TCN70188.1 hypothetical protein CLV25_104143 [Acetobacteroides hydrogenigenes]
MKTSNILILSFVALSVVLTAVATSKVIRTLKAANERSVAIKQNKLGMKELTFAPCQSVAVNGTNSLDVVVRLGASNRTAVFVEDTYKGQIAVAESNGALTVSSKIKKDDAHAVVIVEMPQLQRMVLNDARCTIDSLVADQLEMELLGNSDLNILKGSVQTFSYKGADNSSGSAGELLKVAAWDIRLSDNADLDGVSPNSKLSMSVTGNANVNLKGGKE